jgi:hypothetical protein
MTRPFDYPDATAAGRDGLGAGYGDALTVLVDVTAGRQAVLDGGLADAMPRLSLGGDALRDSLAVGRGSALAGDPAGALVTGSVPGAVVPPPVPVVPPPAAPPPPGPAAGTPVPRRQAAARPAQPRRYGAQPAGGRQAPARPAPAPGRPGQTTGWQPPGRPAPATGWPAPGRPAAPARPAAQQPGTVSRSPRGGYDRTGRLPAPGTGWLPGEGPQTLRQLARVLRNMPTGGAPGTPGWQPGGVRWTQPPVQVRPPAQARPPATPSPYDPAAARREMLRAARQSRQQARGGKRRAPVWLIVVGVIIAINIARGCANSGTGGTDTNVPMPRPAAPVVVGPDSPASTGGVISG